MSPGPTSPLIFPALMDARADLSIQAPTWWRRYTVALCCVVLAVLTRLVLDPAIPHRPTLLLFASVMISAWYGGTGPGLLATLLGTILGDYLFFPPTHSFVKSEWRQYLPVVEFLLEGIFLSWLAGRLHAVWQQSEQSRELLSLLIDGVKDHAIFLLDSQGQVRSWNSGAQRIKGYTSGQILGHSFSCFYTEEEVRAGLPETQLQIATVQGYLETEEWRQRKDGSVFWAGVVLTALRDERGRLRGFSMIVRDLSERMRADQSMRESQAQLQLMADSLPVLIAYIDAEGRYQFNNAAYESWFGLAKETFKGRHMREVIGDAAYQALQGHIEAALAGRTRSFENRIPYKGAGTRDVHVEYVPHRDSDGRVLGFYALIMDISDRRRAEEALLDSERRFRVLAEHAPIGIFLTDREGLATYTNPRCQQIYGFGLQQALGHGWSEFIHPEDRERVMGHWLQLASAAEEFSMEYRAIRPDGDYRWVHDRAVPLLSEQGEVTGYVGTVEDITERKRVEDALREREARLSAVLDTAADAIVTMDEHGLVESVNPAAERMFGYTSAEMVGQNVKILMPSPYREEHDYYLDRYFRTGVRSIIGSGREVQALRKDGTIFSVDLAVSETTPHRLFTGILRDISPRKQLEREVLEIAAQEQRRIGQELHDGVGQELTGLSLMADTLVERLETTSPNEIVLAAKILDGLGRVHRQVRALSRGLIPVEVDPEGLRAALEELAMRTEDQSGVRCALEYVGPVEVADSVTATNLFRIAQEAVSNALRHGRPQNIQIALQGEPGKLSLSVQDDGVGLASRPDQGKGLGIRLMRYRAGSMGGTLAVGPAAVGGTAVLCTVPRATGVNHERSDQDGKDSEGLDC